MNLTDANHMLRLSDSQLAIVRQAAVPLSPSARARLKTLQALQGQASAPQHTSRNLRPRSPPSSQMTRAK